MFHVKRRTCAFFACFPGRPCLFRGALRAAARRQGPDVCALFHMPEQQQQGRRGDALKAARPWARVAGPSADRGAVSLRSTDPQCRHSRCVEGQPYAPLLAQDRHVGVLLVDVGGVACIDLELGGRPARKARQGQAASRQAGQRDTWVRQQLEAVLRRRPSLLTSRPIPGGFVRGEAEGPEDAAGLTRARTLAAKAAAANRPYAPERNAGRGPAADRRCPHAAQAELGPRRKIW